MLPNDPALRNLTEIQRHWIVAHAAEEARQIGRAGASKGSSSSNVANTTSETLVDVGLNDDEFAEHSAKLKRQADYESLKRRNA